MNDRCSGPSLDGFLREWAKHEDAPRVTCTDCHFESSEGYPESHAPGCPWGEAAADEHL